MKLVEWILGRPLRTDEQQKETIGPFAGVAVLGLDALASASYGPEAALTAMLPLGAASALYINQITLCVGLVLLAVYFSYRQTIAAYPNGGGSYVVAKENLGEIPGVLAASALSIDYTLNVAVAISAGVGAAVSALPALLPYTLPLCLGVLTLLTLVNLRGTRTAGAFFLVPTTAFLACMFIVIGVGIVRILHAHGHPTPLATLPRAASATEAVSLWIWLRAFASGCTALTGVEAVSNAVPIFQKPAVQHARRTLAMVVAALFALLLGIAVLTRAYHITATPPGQSGFQSIISQVVSAVFGRGVLYYLTVFATILILSFSANTSFTGFPRVCRMLALDDYLPEEFGRRGSRLVYSLGILCLTTLAAALLIGFRGITDRLIPLFAVGAFLAFTLTQIGMVLHWRRQPESHPWSIAINSFGAVTTGLTLVVLIATKFREGAWLTLVALPLEVALFLSVHRYNKKIERETAANGPIHVGKLHQPLILIPIKRLDRVTRKALRLALSFSQEIHVVQILADDAKMSNLAGEWKNLVEEPIRSTGRKPPVLVTLQSAYREFFEPLIDYARRLSKEQPDRCIAVWVPELTERKWYTFILRHRATRLKRLLLLEGLPGITIINTPWYAREAEELA